MGGGGTPRYLPPPGQGTYPPPHPGPDGAGGTPRYLPPSHPGQGTYPPVQVQMGGRGNPRYLSPPQAKVPTPQDRTAHGVLDTPRSVCLLRLRRRTFLFSVRFPTFLSDNKHHDAEGVGEHVGVEGRSTKNGDAETNTDAVHHRPRENRSCQFCHCCFLLSVSSACLHIFVTRYYRIQKISKNRKAKIWEL